MGYLPQFIAGDATDLGKALVTATPTQAAARDLIGLGEGDSPSFSKLITSQIIANNNGSAGDPAIRFTVTADGFYRVTNGNVGVAIAGNRVASFLSSSFMLTGVPLRLDSQTTGAAAYLYNGGSNTIEQRNGTAGQIFRLHKTYTSNSNREYLQFDTTASTYRIGSSVGSAGGSQRSLQLGNWSADGNWNSSLTVTVGGRVGVGEAVPAKLIELSTQQDTDGLFIRRASMEDSCASLFFGASTIKQAKAGILFQRTAVHQGRGTLHFCTSDSGSETGLFVTPADARLSITRKGDVGIGTTEPSARLHVVGTVTLEGLATTDPAKAGQIWNDNGTLKISAG